MRWPWTRREKRESGGDFADAVVRLIEAQAAGTAADASSTAAIEAVSGLLSRALGSAEVVGAPWVQEAVSPAVLAQIGRDLIRNGDSMHVIRVGADGEVVLIPASSWHWEGNHDPSTWTVRVTAYGPSTSTTWNLSGDRVVFVRWGSTPGQSYVGIAPASWAHTTARLNSEAERSLADEAKTPLAAILTYVEGHEVDGDDDTLAPLKAEIASARGKAVIVESTAGGMGEGRSNAPVRDWDPRRLGPEPPAAMVELGRDTFDRMLAACGCSPALFDDSDGTSKREALRQWHLGTVLPHARLLETELSAKLATPVRLTFDKYPLDLAGRAQAFQKLVAGGVAVNEALATSGLLAEPD